MNRFNIAVDSGKYETKGIIAINNSDPAKDKLDRFRTSVTEASKDVSAFNMTSVSFEGKTYLVGEKLQKMNDPNSSKDTFTHKLCIYTSIARLLNGVYTDNPEVNVIIGCPLDIFTNRDKRTKYLENILPAGKKLSVTLNGKDISYTIASAYVLPESSGIIYSKAMDFRSDIVNVIDIGGLNVNGCQFENLKPVISTIFTENLGGNTLSEDLKEILVSRGFERAKLADNVLENALRKGSIYGIDDGDKIIKDIKEAKAKDILKACEEKNWQLKLVSTQFIGGASLLMKDELKAAFSLSDTSFYDDPVFANVKGFLKFLRRK